jgi:SRSO17 transposase
MFGRREVRETGGAFLDGLLSGVARKTGWLLAEQAGAARPYRMQSLLGRSRWQADDLRNSVRTYAVEALGDADGVLVVDETGFLKKGRHSVGVARQYSGTAGRIENCQVGVFLSYASRFGHALIDRWLYLPKDWADDAARRAAAAIPPDTGFMTKPEIARDLIASALDAGIPCAYVLADALYGSDKSLRVMLERREQPHVLAVRSNERLMAGSLQTRTAAEIADAVAAGDWQRLAAGEGAKGPRLTTGHASACSGCRNRGNPSTIGCWSGAACATRKTVLTTSCSRPPMSASSNSPVSPGSAGRSRPASRPPRTNSASTIARPAPGMAGIVT